MHSVPGSPGPSGYRAGTPTPPAVRDRRLGSAGWFIQPSGNTSKYLRTHCKPKGQSQWRNATLQSKKEDFIRRGFEGKKKSSQK